MLEKSTVGNASHEPQSSKDFCLEGLNISPDKGIYISFFLKFYSIDGRLFRVSNFDSYTILSSKKYTHYI
jgi:hypothetical protein